MTQTPTFHPINRRFLQFAFDLYMTTEGLREGEGSYWNAMYGCIMTPELYCKIIGGKCERMMHLEGEKPSSKQEKRTRDVMDRGQVWWRHGECRMFFCSGCVTRCNSLLQQDISSQEHSKKNVNGKLDSPSCRVSLL